MIVLLSNIFLCLFKMLSCQVSYNVAIEGKTYTVNLMQKQVIYIILSPVFVLFIIIIYSYSECIYFSFVNVSSYWLFICLLFFSFKKTFKVYVINIQNLNPQCMLPSSSFPVAPNFFLVIHVFSWRMNFDNILSLLKHNYDLF